MTRGIALVAALTALALTPSPAAATTAGPAGHWRLNEGVGNVATDTSGFGDNGIVTGGAQWMSSPTGGALNFDGATGAIRIPNAPQLQPAGAVSVSTWVARAGTPGAFRYILAKGATTCIAAAYGLYSGPNGGLEFYVSRGHGTTYARSPDAGPRVWDGKWHLVVGTFDGTTIRLYVDGAEVGSGTAYPGDLEYLQPDSNDLYIGDYPGCNQKNFLGSIADVQIWDRALGRNEVAAMVQPPAKPALPPIIPTSTTPVYTVAAVPTYGDKAATNPPMLRRFKLSQPRLSAHVIGRRSVISYTDSQAAHVTFTILKQAPKHGCMNKARHASTAATGCNRYIRLRSFAHQDHAGRNVLRFPAGLRLAPAAYLLRATPKTHGVAGPTITIGFTVLPSRQHR